MTRSSAASNESDAAPFLVSVLDQSPIPRGTTGSQALLNSIDLAQHCDRLGYHRYWLAEHHGTPALACAAPEVLIGPIASRTNRIRLGSGGIMLPHYSPLKVAEAFSMLSGLFPGRIDLGIGRAAGTDQHTALALQRDRRHRVPPDDFRDHLEEMIAYLTNRMPPEHPFARLARTLPGKPEAPEVWLLGSSPQSAVWAAELGLPYCFADFINAAGADIAQNYRERFRPSELLQSPRTAVAVWAICADSDDEAQRLSASFQMMMTLMHRGQLIAVPPVEEALLFLDQNQGGPLDLMTLDRRIIAGAPPTVRAGVEAVAQEYGADEVLLVNIMHDHAARRRSYELVAEAFDLKNVAARRAADVFA